MKKSENKNHIQLRFLSGYAEWPPMSLVNMIFYSFSYTKQIHSLHHTPNLFRLIILTAARALIAMVNNMFIYYKLFYKQHADY